MNAFALRDNAPVRDSATIPGEHLRVARLAKSISQTHVANYLHLNVTMVEALETGDYAHLPSPVFVRGYLRNYARMMGVDESALLATYQVQPSRELPTPPPGPINNIRPEIRSSHAVVRLVTWILIGGLILLLAMWWQGRLGWEDMPLETPTAAPVNANPDPHTTITIPAITPPNGGTTAAPEVANTVEPSREPASNGAPVVPAAVAAIAPVPGTTAMPSRVVMEFLAPTWVQVKDASGTALVSGKQRKGEKRTLEGRPPYAVALGNRHKVRITVNDQTVPVKAPRRGTVSRFTLDPAKLTP